MKKIFELPYEPYTCGPKPNGHNERCIEIPWGHSLIPEEGGKILDVGWAFSEARWLHPLLEMSKLDLYGVDIADSCIRHGDMLEKFNLKAIKHDIRNPLPDEYNSFFDVVFCISTIEHIGFENDWYFKEENFSVQPDVDKPALANLMKVVTPTGVLGLTVPYGKYKEMRQFRQYDHVHLQALIEPYKVLRYDLFHYDGNGWMKATEKDCADKHYGHYGFVSSTALACVLLAR